MKQLFKLLITFLIATPTCPLYPMLRAILARSIRPATQAAPFRSRAALCKPTLAMLTSQAAAPRRATRCLSNAAVDAHPQAPEGYVLHCYGKSGDEGIMVSSKETVKGRQFFFGTLHDVWQVQAGSKDSLKIVPLINFESGIHSESDTAHIKLVTKLGNIHLSYHGLHPDEAHLEDVYFHDNPKNPARLVPLLLLAHRSKFYLQGADSKFKKFIYPQEYELSKNPPRIQPQPSFTFEDSSQSSASLHQAYRAYWGGYIHGRLFADY